jgi:hypothetical protein
MNIKLPLEQEQWLNARVAGEQFDSPEAAVRQMIAERMAFEADDLAGQALCRFGAERCRTRRGRIPRGRGCGR